jgi:hypothetical protein
VKDYAVFEGWANPKKQEKKKVVENPGWYETGPLYGTEEEKRQDQDPFYSPPWPCAASLSRVSRTSLSPTGEKVC